VRVVVGHANPDFDAYASTVAGTKLFPGSKGVFLGSQNANVRTFHNLHEEFLEFVDLKVLDMDAVDSVVMVDTRDPDRIAELGDIARRDGVEVIVYDHHPRQTGDIVSADDRSKDVGATTSIMVHEIRDRGIGITPLEASVMLLGVHEDTGSLTFPGTTAYDADAAAWLMANGADIEVLNQYVGRQLDAAQLDLLEQLTASLEMWEVNGQPVAVGVAEAAQYVDSAGVLTHYVVEDLGYRVAVAIVRMPGRVQVVARSRLAEVDVGAVMTLLGGGGHRQAASARFHDEPTPEILDRLREALTAQVKAPLRAADVMTSPVREADPTWTMRRAGELMATWGHGAVPVVENGRLVGLVTRKDVDKATRHGLDHAPVTGFMNRDLVTVPRTMPLGELETLLATRGVGRLPVVDDSGAILGIVTRQDVLRAEHGDAYLAGRVASAHPEATERFRVGVASLMPAEIVDALHRLGVQAEEQGTRAYVVGGFVRDMILGVPNLDIDVVVEGDGVAFAETLAELIGAHVRVHRRFGTAVISFSDQFHVDIASARTEYYTRPGALPTVEASSLREDLFRRDFTINAMAACLEPSCFGAVSDPFAGLRDLDEGVVRVLHGLSFVDDPTRVLRAARFEARYGFSMDAGTEGLARRAVSMGMLAEVSGARVREEFLDILDEPRPATALTRLEALGALGALLPDGADGEAVVAGVWAAEEALVTLAGQWLPRASAPNRRDTLFSVLAAAQSTRATVKWLRHLHANRVLVQHAEELAEHGPAVLRALQSARGLRDSRLYRLVHPLSSETIAVLWSRCGELGRERIERYVAKLSGMRLAVTGRDLIAINATPGDAFSAILARALDDRLDGRAVGREAELANLRRLAIRAGLIGNRKDPA
jgi:tRNA nucleotidyltransferase (CCA-adding enzyme)